MVTPAELISEKLLVSPKEAAVILEKAVSGGEITTSQETDEWLHNRLLPNCVFIDELGYSKMCVDALKILSSVAGTDYGSSRQRDMGQLWADMTRGYLGEYAFQLFLKQKYEITSTLGHEKGDIEGYLPMDIHSIERVGEPVRQAKVRVGVKAAKWNGIWMDIPGDQFNHSDIHVLVKVGAGRDHLFAFFKSLSVFKDKVLKRGEEIGSLSKEESSDLYGKLPSFRPIPAYICGFVKRVGDYQSLSYTGRAGRMHYKIQSWNGPISAGDLEAIKRKEQISGNVKFEGIGDFSHESGYLFNAGSLLWRQEDWNKVCNAL